MHHRSSLAFVLLVVSSCVNVLDVNEAGDAAPLFVAEGDDLLDSFAAGDDGNDDARLTHVIAARGAFSRIGLRFDAQGPVAIDARVSRDGGASFAGWREATVTFAEGAANNAFVDVDTAGATHLQLRFVAPVESQLTFLAVDAFDKDAERDSADVDPAGNAEQGLAGDLVRPRSAWGARTRNCTGSHTPSKITIHHTETPNNDNLSVAARIRQIQSYHIDVRGWCDIGYHFLIGSDGAIYQGRGETTVGAHVAGANTGNVGVSFIGNFQTSAPSAAMQQSGSRLLEALGRAYDIDLDRTHVKGHREQGSTDCPGTALYGQINNIISQANSTTPPPPPAPPADDPAPATCVQVQVTAATLNVRPTASTSSSPRGTVAAGDVLDVVDVEEDGQAVNGTTLWYQVDGDVSGFVSGAYVRCSAVSEPVEPVEPADPEPTEPVVDDVYDGLDRGTAQIPRAGLVNDTLRGALGVSTEPHGSLFQDEGRDWVRGRVSHFGGPNDTGVSSTETGAVSGERLRSLNNPVNASAATIASRPADFYFIAMRWDYTPHGRSFWQNARVVVKNPANGRKVVLRVVDWGPNTNTRRVLDISPQAIKDLGATTDDNLLVAFAREGAALGLQ